MNPKSKTVVSWFIKVNGAKKRWAAKDVARAVCKTNRDGSSEQFIMDDVVRICPARVPDANKICTRTQRITWIEADDWNHSGAKKIEALAEFNDQILDYGWGVTLILIKIEPIPALVIFTPEMLMPFGLWRCASPILRNMPLSLHRMLQSRETPEMKNHIRQAKEDQTGEQQ